VSVPSIAVGTPGDGDPIEAWASLPRRIYLDTCSLQAVHDYGGVIWDGEPFVAMGRAGRVKDFNKDLEALRMIFLVNERAMFELVVTEATLREVRGRNDHRYTQWVNDVRDTWLVQSAGEEIPPWRRTFDQATFGMVSKNDRILLQDALDLRCDAFLTMEQNLPDAAEHVERKTGLRIMGPTTYWELLDRWAKLY
jgi:hypothetical protein